MADGPTIRRGKSKQDHPTPWNFIRACEHRFGPIVFDLAASHGNQKAPRYFTKEDDSFKQDWHKIVGNLWLNPEFDHIAPWAEKCAREAELGAKILLLTPASIGSNWFSEHVHGYADVHALNGRITFEGMRDAYPKDCILSAYGFGGFGFQIWRWNPLDLI